MTGDLVRRGKFRHTQRGERHMMTQTQREGNPGKMEAEIESHVATSQGIPEATTN